MCVLKTLADCHCHLHASLVSALSAGAWQREGQAESCGHQTTEQLGRGD